MIADEFGLDLDMSDDQEHHDFVDEEFLAEKQKSRLCAY